MHIRALQQWCESTLPLCARWQSQPIDPTCALNTKRQQEHQAGRDCAHHVLRSFGACESVDVNADRSPRWPNGFVGSISHSDQTAWAVVAEAKQLLSVGVDTETIVDQPKVDVHSSIATEAEWDVASTLSFSRPATFALVFSAKESFYKCWYPVTESTFDFLDVEVIGVNDFELTIACRPGNPNYGQQPQQLRVPFSVTANEVYTATWMDRSWRR